MRSLFPWVLYCLHLINRSLRAHKVGQEHGRAIKVATGFVAGARRVAVGFPVHALLPALNKSDTTCTQGGPGTWSSDKGRNRVCSGHATRIRKSTLAGK